MFEFARYDAAKRVRGSVYLSVGISLLAAFAVWAYPSYSEAMDMEQLREAFPEPMIQAFNIQTMASLEGFLAVELYMFGWIILLGLYMAYSAASIVADDVDRGRMDTLLSMPVSRPRLAIERFAALGVPILMVNVVTPVVVLVSADLIGESLSAVDVIALHLLSIPYLFACAGIGLLASVLFDRASIAQRVALGVTFGIYLVESLLRGTEYEALGVIAPMRYFDPNEVLLDGTYDLVGAAVLLGMTAVLLVVSQVIFVRRDI
ncbi:MULTISPECIES: ABC transporter permease subunit [Halolamina]|uniref:ABC-2 type transport system permease protein n=1 Tax=Halolamina pelagica TaxID=699431 RepID=A0A1I5UW92_9EURY|nr:MULTISPECIES: ABC transporter permease subunit [Halolamina]NHX36842.1 ABC transporter permease subunit [Halolamina sp. R1-12]SFP99594.1 ABC-2 type transport system permease protein [Halolamina pelagica]